MFKLPVHHSPRLLIVLWRVIQTIRTNSFFPSFLSYFFSFLFPSTKMILSSIYFFITSFLLSMIYPEQASKPVHLYKI